MVSVERGENLWRLPAIQQLVAVTLLGFVGFAATLSSLPWWAVQGGATVSTAGLVTTALLGATVAMQVLVPAMVRRFGNARSLAVGLVALGAPAPFYALSSDLAPLLALSAVRGIGFAILTVVGSTLTWTLAPPGRHGEAAGIYGLAVGGTAIVVVPGAVALAQNLGYWPVALIAALPLLGVPSALRLREDHEQEVTPSATAAVRHRSTVRTVLVPSLVLLVVTLSGSGLVTFLPIELPEGLLAPAALLLFGLSSAVIRWRVGILADRLGTRVLLPASVASTSLGLAGVTAGLLADRPVLLLVAALVAGAGYGAVQNLTLVTAFARVGPGETPTASAVWNLSFDGGTAVGAVVVGTLAAAAWGDEQVGIPLALGACAALVMLAVPLGLVCGATRPRRGAPAPRG